MGKTTDSLLNDASHFSPEKNLRELDMLLTSGERISAALTAMAINSKGGKALSLTGSQAGIITDDNHTNARIIEIRPYRVFKALEEDFVVVVSGFQGVSFTKEVTTLGRGGSDVSAVALASALDALKCEIYSDVDGVFAADPRIIDNPKKLDSMSYEEMQEMAEAGAKVLHPKAMEFGKIKNTPIYSKSSFEPEKEGTLITNLEGRIKPRIVGIASEEKVTLISFSLKSLNNLHEAISFANEKSLKVKQISFRKEHSGFSGSFIVPEKENYHLESVLSEMEKRFGMMLEIVSDYAAVSLVGAGINERYDYLLSALSLLEKNNVSLGSIHTTSFRISFLVKREKMSDAVKCLYQAFITPDLT